jgi:hypothetical protein
VSIVDPDRSFTVTTLQQWKEFGDAVVIVRVSTDRDDPATSKDPAVNGGLYGRLADFTVTHVFWVRDAAHRPPAHFTAGVWGWWVKDGRPRVPIVGKGDPRYEAGHEYLVVLDRFREGWTTSVGMPFDDGRSGVGEWLGQTSPLDPGAARLLGNDTAGVQRLMDSARLSAMSRRYSALDPAARAQKIMFGRR